MVVKRKNIFFEYHPFEKRGGVNLDGGDFEKKSGEKPFSLRPAPSSDTRPCHAEGGGLQRIAVQKFILLSAAGPRCRRSLTLFR